MIYKTNKFYDFIIFGTKGDLARKKLFPSFYLLEKENQLHEKTKIIGVGRADWSNQQYCTIIKKSLILAIKKNFCKNVWKKFSNRLHFCNLNVFDISNFKKIKKIINNRKKILINYFAIPPHTFFTICKGLYKYKLNLYPSRIIVEKPLGSSLSTAKNINKKIGKYFKEKQIFRIDHYLGKETIMNLLTLRFSNSLFMYNWNNKTIDHIQITVAENIGIEGRWEYFNSTGQIKDMVQSHILQILAIITMSIPKNLKSDSIRDEKVKIIKSLQPITKKNVQDKIVIGQYTKGEINKKKVISYIKESGKKRKSHTETFIAMRVDINHKNWKGVPIYIRTGKRMPQKCSEITIVFKNTPQKLSKCQFNSLHQSKLIIRIQPNESITLQMLNRYPSLKKKNIIVPIQLNFNYATGFHGSYLHDAYERLLLESIKGKQELFVRKDEVEASWKWIDCLINALENKKIPLYLYKSGSWGPKESQQLLQKDGYIWNKII